MWAFIVYAVLVVFDPYVALEDAYQGPGRYRYRYEFARSEVVLSGVVLDGKPDDWQPIYDEHWLLIAGAARHYGRPAPHDGCWLRHDCPPLLIQEVELIKEGNVVEAGADFLWSLLRLVFKHR
jgi:hypothetical protein